MVMLSALIGISLIFWFTIGFFSHVSWFQNAFRREAEKIDRQQLASQSQSQIVTGAGRGIGKVIAKDAVKSGAKVALGSRSTEELKTLSDEIELHGGESFFHELDVTNVSSIEAFMEAVVNRFGRIDVLINNAAIDPKFKKKTVNGKNTRLEFFSAKIGKRNLL